MYKSIMVPLDGSGSAERALRPAVSIARAARAHVHLATVAVPHAGGQFDITFGEVDPGYLEEVAGRIRGAGVATVSGKMLRGSDIASQLESYRVEVGAELTVMSSHGRGPVERAWLGSVADRFVRTTEAPVLLVRAAAADSAAGDLGADVPFRRVLVPLDGSALSESALGPTAELGGNGDSVYILLRVIDPPHALGSPWLPKAVSATEGQLRAARQKAEAELASVTKSFGGRGYAVEPVAEFGQPVAKGILDVAERRDADVIAIATHGRGGLRRVVMGSVTDKVVRGTDHPVLIVRPRVA